MRLSGTGMATENISPGDLLIRVSDMGVQQVAYHLRRSLRYVTLSWNLWRLIWNQSRAS